MAVLADCVGREGGGGGVEEMEGEIKITDCFIMSVSALYLFLYQCTHFLHHFGIPFSKK